MVGKVLTTEKFIEKAILKHGERYNYEKVVYKDSKTKVIITCLKHGDFEQVPQSHLQGCGCPKCGNNISTTEEFTKKANLKHNNFYDYSKVVYEDTKSKVIITCSLHGDFEQMVYLHLKGHGCIKCAHKKKTLTKEEFTKKAILKHGDRYNYEKVDYKNAHVKVIITCPKHGDFEQEPQSHLQGCCCPKCSQCKYSKISLSWIKYLQICINKEIQSILSPEGEYIIQSTRFRADGYCKETNTIYEFLGDFWHGNPKIYNLNDINSVLKISYRELYKQTQEKKKKILELGYNYIEIWENDWCKAIKAVTKIQKIWKKYIKKITNN